MSRVCTVCVHDRRGYIERAIVAGTSAREISASFRVSEDAVQRHKAEHLPPSLAQARKADGDRGALDVVVQLKAINAASLSILDTAREENDPQTALKAVDRIQRQIELQAKLLGQLDERPHIQLVLTPDWLRVRGVLLAALAPYGEARLAVAEALARVENPVGGAP